MSLMPSLLPKAGLCLAFFAACAAFAPPVSAQNALDNPGFESGDLSPWNDVSDGSHGLPPGVDWHVTTDAVHSGLYASSCTGPKRLEQTFAPIEIDDITQLSFWAKSDPSEFGSGGGTLYAILNGNDIAGLSGFGGDSTYRFYDFTEALKHQQIPGDHVTLTGLVIEGDFDFFHPSAYSTLYIDDVTLGVRSAPVPEASTTVSLGLLLVLGGLAVTVRRRKALKASL